MLDDLEHDLTTRSGTSIPVLRSDVEESCPQEIVLDPARARVALKYAIENAAAAAKDKPVHVTMRGGPDRWVIEVGLDIPPPPSVKPTELRTDTFETHLRDRRRAAGDRPGDRRQGQRAVRWHRGLDVDEARGSTVVLEWPVRLEDVRPDVPGTASRTR